MIQILVETTVVLIHFGKVSHRFGKRFSICFPEAMVFHFIVLDLFFEQRWQDRRSHSGIFQAAKHIQVARHRTRGRDDRMRQLQAHVRGT